MEQALSRNGISFSKQDLILKLVAGSEIAWCLRDSTPTMCPDSMQHN